MIALDKRRIVVDVATAMKSQRQSRYRQADLDSDLLRLVLVLSGEVERWPVDPVEAAELIQVSYEHRVDGLVDCLARTGEISASKDRSGSAGWLGSPSPSTVDDGLGFG